MSSDTLGVGKSHLGFMNFNDRQMFQDIDENPINFQYVKPIHSEKEWVDIGKEGPRIIVTSMASME